MARGREAARAAARRAIEAQELADAKDQELAALRVAHKKEVTALRDEIKRLRADRMADASKLAADEVARRIAEYEEKQLELGLSVDVARHLLYQKDKLVRNACRYVSMTTGKQHSTALNMVVTWMTDKDFKGSVDPTRLLVDLGLPANGWVAAMFKHYRHYMRNDARKVHRKGGYFALSLDNVLEQYPSSFHPDFRESWYPPLNYADGIVIADEDEGDSPAVAQ